MEQLVDDIDGLLRNALNGGPHAWVERRDRNGLYRWALYPSFYDVELDPIADELRLVGIDLRVDASVSDPEVWVWDLIEQVQDAHVVGSIAWERHLEKGESRKEATEAYRDGFRQFFRGRWG